MLSYAKVLRDRYESGVYQNLAADSVPAATNSDLVTPWLNNKQLSQLRGLRVCVSVCVCVCVCVCECVSV